MDDIVFGTMDGKRIGKLGFLSDTDLIADDDLDLFKDMTFEAEFDLTSDILKAVLPQGEYNAYVLNRDGYLSPENGWFTPIKENPTMNAMEKFLEGLGKIYKESLQDDRIRGRHPIYGVELKPCPFCGEKAYLDGLFLATADGTKEINGCEVGCRNCEIYFRDLWEHDDIVEKWNMRNGEENTV